MQATIAAIIAIAKAVPVIEKWLALLLAEFKKYQDAKIKKETIEAVNVAIETRDQREVEAPEYSGKPSGVGDIRDANSIRLREPKKD